MEKLNDLVVWVSGLVVAGTSWVFTRLFRSIDQAHSRIDRIEAKMVDRNFLESQLVPIRNDLNLIVKHLLNKNEGAK